MDIQGAEFMALKGMEKTIAGNHPLVMVTEFTPELIEKSGLSPVDFIRRLRQFGFSIQVINEKAKRLDLLDDEKIFSLCDRRHYVNLYLSK